jgi:hypothetical protein
MNFLQRVLGWRGRSGVVEEFLAPFLVKDLLAPYPGARRTLWIILLRIALQIVLQIFERNFLQRAGRSLRAERGARSRSREELGRWWGGRELKMWFYVCSGGVVKRRECVAPRERRERRQTRDRGKRRDAL